MTPEGNSPPTLRVFFEDDPRTPTPTGPFAAFLCALGAAAAIGFALHQNWHAGGTDGQFNDIEIFGLAIALTAVVAAALWVMFARVPLVLSVIMLLVSWTSLLFSHGLHSSDAWIEEFGLIGAIRIGGFIEALRRHCQLNEAATRSGQSLGCVPSDN